MADRNKYLESKHRYEILDGLRGVAALTVVIFHCFETYCPPGGQQIVNHGYLAVDFFFVLSGFVVGYAYDDRWDRMTTWYFFKRRLTRLHPLVIAGAVLGLCLLFPGSGAFPLIQESGPLKIALCFVMCLLMIPCSGGMDIRGWQDFYPLNCPAWSLTYEYVGNILYALILRHLSKTALGVLCVCSAFLTLDITLGWDVWGLLPSGPIYKVFGGWYLTVPEVYIGLTRFLYPFLCGMLISRLLSARSTSANPSGSPLHIKYGYLWTSVILLTIFVTPCIGGKDGIANGIFQAVSILCVFPIVVLVGAGSITHTKSGTKISKWLGEVSYPLYITHYPLVYMQISFAEGHPDSPAWIHFMVSAGVVVLSVIIARCLYKAYDLPVRHWLTEHWLKKTV